MTQTSVPARRGVKHHDMQFVAKATKKMSRETPLPELIADPARRHFDGRSGPRRLRI